jgi:uncharacterized protein with PQ loop repeat
MKNSVFLTYFGFFIFSLLGMLIHIRLMIETDRPIHFFCTLLWMVICLCLATIMRRGMIK